MREVAGIYAEAAVDCCRDLWRWLHHLLTVPPSD